MPSCSNLPGDNSLDSVVITLKSVTIFWTDLGLPKLLDSYQRDKLALWWDDEVEPWLTVAIKNHYNPHETGVWFSDPHDAALFLTRFNGTSVI